MLKLDKSKTTTTICKRNAVKNKNICVVKKTSIKAFLCFFITQIEHFMDSINFHHVPTTDDITAFMRKQYLSTARMLADYNFEDHLAKAPSALEVSTDSLSTLLNPLAELFHHYEEYMLFNEANVLGYTNSQSDDFEAFKEALEHAKMDYINKLKEFVDHIRRQL